MLITNEEKQYIHEYKEECKALIAKIRALSILGYIEYMGTHLSKEFAEQGYSWFSSTYVVPAEMHLYNPEKYPYPEDMEKVLAIESDAAARYPLFICDDLRGMPSATTAETAFFVNYPLPNSNDFDDFDSLEDAWIAYNEDLQELLKNMMSVYKYDCMAFRGHSFEDVEEIEHIGHYGSFSRHDDTLFSDEVPISKINDLKKVAEDYYHNERLFNYYYTENLDHFIFYNNIRTVLQTAVKNSTKSEEREERQRLRQELDDFVK